MENPLGTEVLLEKSLINGPFAIAMFDYWRIHIYIYIYMCGMTQLSCMISGSPPFLGKPLYLRLCYIPEGHLF